jgi:alpha-galactosidase
MNCMNSSIRSLILLSLLSSKPLWAGSQEFRGCYAKWDEGKLTVGNARFERAWVAADSGLAPVSFVMKGPDVEWLSEAARKVKTVGTVEVSASNGRRGMVGSEGLRVEVTVSGKVAERRVLWVFPELGGVIGERLDGVEKVQRAEQRQTSGIEAEPGKSATAAVASGGEMMRLNPKHLRLTEIALRDQTDHHNELMHEREWLLWANESPIEVRGCVLTVENVLDGSGLAFLKLAPLPHARPDPEAVDFQVQPGARAVTSFFHGYPVAAVAYRGGKAGRTQALHTVQRALRNHVPGRDGMFLSNTWGDRSRDARIREDFLLKEVEAGAELGVDVVQIDDGWQKGRSSNSADAKGKGVWNGYWAADAEFWTPDRERFPKGLEPVVKAARAKGMKFGLWFGPDSSNDAANWQRDANHLLEMHRSHGIDYFKIDSMKTLNAVSLQRQRAMFDRMLEGSKGAMTFDLDVTAEVRPGYFGLSDIGPVFVENRYTDWGSYWPHQTLRSLWSLSHAVDPLRLRIEVLNNARSTEKYGDDPLAPARYPADTLFAIAMMANPLGWFEASNLPKEYVAQMKPLVATWKKERERMHGGSIVPVGSAPDGVAWTGFASAAADGKGGYALLFRELNQSADYVVDLALLKKPSRATVIGGRGTARIENGRLAVNVPDALDFIWVKIE